MVNIPPIPPLLCSTPPPIDFGEDDEDLDILPPALDGMEDDFSGFLVDDGIKTDEPLPSPRPSSSCDLPPSSIYDGLIPPEEDFTKTSSLQQTEAKNITKSKKVTEAFNFKVRNNTNDERNILQDENECPAYENKNAEQVLKETQGEMVSPKQGEIQESSQAVCIDVKNILPDSGSCKNFKDLKIEPLDAEVKTKVNKKQVECMQNVVSIEDIEDDLSDDELYSPKTPKNFVDTDNMTDFFKIEEIKSQNTSGNNLKPYSKIIDSKSLESKDNNEYASLKNENDNEFVSFSSYNFKQNQFDIPPSLSNDLNSNDNDVDDDFGDFADFQETHFVNNAVPVENVNVNQLNSDLETNSINGFNKYHNVEDNSNLNSIELVTNNIESAKEEYENVVCENKDLTNNSFSMSLKIDVHKKIVEEKVDLHITSQELQNKKVDSLFAADENCNEPKNNYATNKSKQPIKQLNHNDNSLSDLSDVAEVDNNEDFGNFAEFSNIPPNAEDISVQAIEKNETSTSNNDDNNDEYNEFAGFESQLDVTKSQKKQEFQDDVNEHEEEEDDDDFGDFNTAEPININNPSSIVAKTSQNMSTPTPVLTSNNLNERISKILQLMFTPNPNVANDDPDDLEANKIQDIPFTSIDAAKALEYQWLSSDTRHSFIRSLGIDSRNILYGDNWNPSLPRFAANLSFNPLKPMKPVQSSSISGDTSLLMESIPVSSSETKQAIEIAGTIDLKSSIVVEQTTDALKGNDSNIAIDAAAPMPYMSTEPPSAEPALLAIFERTLENEDEFSKTPPISEMESVTTFSSSIPAATIDMELHTSPTELEEIVRSSLNINEVVVTSTFTGSFKETHIYTPSKSNDIEIKHAIATPPTSLSSPSKSSPIDFDYEKAAMGVIIDETVVKKEYRDVEYNPPFTLESLSKSVSPKIDMFETNSCINTNLNILSSTDEKENVKDDEDANDEFSEFQSVPSEVALPAEAAAMPTTTKPLEIPKAIHVSHGGMILSPAILIPQALSMESQKPKIEWGDSTATINPEELARIEELFPEPKSLKSAASSQKSTPTHQIVASTPSISATVANKELEGNINNLNDDEDDWSDFVSVTVTNNISANRTVSNNNVLAKSPAGSPFQQRSPIVTNKIPPATHSNFNNDDEWSEFVSSAPPLQQPNAYRVPQFNSGAWQNANFYNNPLSMYHKAPLNIPTTAAKTHSAQKYLYNNNNNYNVSQHPHPMANNAPSTMMVNNSNQTPHKSYKQKVHVMQNFSTAPVPTPERLTAAAAAAKNNQFQSIGSAKVAPSIALIPDLGFVAPAIPTHTSFINSLPKPSINMKK